jgi:tetratricopeptide (TPR) repeat protein
MNNRKLYIVWALFCAGFFILGASPVCFSEIASIADNITAAQRYYDKGKEYLNQGDFLKADEAFKQAEFLLVPNQESIGLIAEAKHFEVLKTPDASGQSEASTVKPENTIQSSVMDSDQAINKCKESLKSDQRNSKVYYYNLGVLYARNNDYLNSAKMFDKVISLDRKDYEAYYNLGAIYETVFVNRPKAIECYQMYL